MSQSFEFYEGTATENASVPRITVRRSGQMILTQAAVDLFDDEVAFVQIGFNEATKAVGLRAVAEGGSGRYRLRQQKNSRLRLVDGKRFFAHRGLTPEKVRSFEAQSFGDGIVGFYLNGTEEATLAGSEPPPTTEPVAIRSRRKTHSS